MIPGKPGKGPLLPCLVTILFPIPRADLSLASTVSPSYELNSTHTEFLLMFSNILNLSKVSLLIVICFSPPHSKQDRSQGSHYKDKDAV